MMAFLWVLTKGGGLAEQGPSRNRDTEIRELVRRLGEVSSGAYDALWRLVSLGERAVPALIEALNEDDEKLRLGAIMTLGRIGDARAVAPLAQMLKHGGRVRTEALRALGRIGGPEAATHLLRALAEERSEYLQAEIILALGAIGDLRAVEPLARLLKRSPKKWVRRAAAQALGRFRDPRARQALKAAVAEDPDWQVYRAAKRALEQMECGLYRPGPTLTLDRWTLIAVVKQPEPPEGAEAYVRRWYEWRRKEAARARGEEPPLTALSPWPGPTVDDFAPVTEIERARGKLLEMASHPKRAEEVIEALMEHFYVLMSPYPIAKRAQELVIQIGAPAVPALVNGLRRGDNHFRFRCAECLIAIGDSEGLEAVRTFISSLPPHDWRGRELTKELQRRSSRLSEQ
jgi:HEAT repeat protein